MLDNMYKIKPIIDVKLDKEGSLHIIVKDDSFEICGLRGFKKVMWDLGFKPTKLIEYLYEGDTDWDVIGWEPTK